jgi:hypothetical protein
MADRSLDRGAPIRLELFAPEFFATPPKKLIVEENEGAGRTYFLARGRIVAVGVAEKA